MPPPGRMAVTASASVAASRVGPVTVMIERLNGATIAESSSRSSAGKRSTDCRTNSMFRAMLWLVSTSSAKVVGTVSEITASTACGASSSKMRKSAVVSRAG